MGVIGTNEQNPTQPTNTPNTTHHPSTRGVGKGRGATRKNWGLWPVATLCKTHQRENTPSLHGANVCGERHKPGCTVFFCQRQCSPHPRPPHRCDDDNIANGDGWSSANGVGCFHLMLATNVLSFGGVVYAYGNLTSSDGCSSTCIEAGTSAE